MPHTDVHYDAVYEAVFAAIEAAGYEPRSYSGRSMYGKLCIGVDCDDTIRAAIDITIALAEEEDSEFLEELRNAKTDSMGRGEILYWSGIGWHGESTDSEES